MNAADTLLEAQTLSLLRRLAREQDARTRRITDDAATQAAEIVRKARSEARARVRQAVVDMRREQARVVVQRRAALDTSERQRQQVEIGEWLEQAWQALPDALLARWKTAAGRAAWCDAALQCAARDLLQHDSLQVEVDASWLPDVAPIILAHGTVRDRTLSPVPIEGLGPGLRVRAGHACVDATIKGLLAPRARLAAELLAELDRQLAGERQELAP